LKRLDLAFKAFFRRIRAGEEPGFPRFKAKERFPGFGGFKTHGDGFRFTPGKGWCHGKLRLSGVGEMTARGEARTPGRVVCCDLQRKADGWYLSLVVECEPHRESGDTGKPVSTGAWRLSPRSPVTTVSINCGVNVPLFSLRNRGGATRWRRASR
jgi:putative transposase